VPDLASDPKAAAIAKAAAALNEYRENWLNPPEHVIEIEEVSGLGKRIVPKDTASAAIVARRTLTALYNERPAWLDHAHRNIDRAVAAAYGWSEDISTADALFELLALNLERSA
jgi:ribonuclease D